MLVQEMWKTVRKYYHNKEAKVTKCVVTLHHTGDSRIECDYAEEDGQGGVTMLSFEDMCNLHEELKSLGIAEVKKTQKLVITLEIGCVVEVKHTYYIV